MGSAVGRGVGGSSAPHGLGVQRPVAERVVECTYLVVVSPHGWHREGGRWAPARQAL